MFPILEHYSLFCGTFQEPRSNSSLAIDLGRRLYQISSYGYSTVTDFAKFLG